MFGLFIIYDTKVLISGGGRYNLTTDDYIVGPLIIFLDIINIFLFIVRIFGRAKRMN